MVERLDIVVSERGAVTVRRSIAGIGTAAQRSGVQVTRFRGQLESVATRTNRQLRGLVGSARAFSDQLFTLRNGIAALGLGLAVRQLAQFADAFTNIQNRLRTVTTGTAELNAVTDELFNISQRTRQSFESTANTFASVALATQQLGVTTEETLQFTESLNQAVILSGANSQSAAAGLFQLSQGLGAGALRGEELNSVLDQLPVVADVIAEQLGTVRGGLRALAEQGQITSGVVIEAFAAAREELGERFAQSVATLGQAFTVLNNAAIRTIGVFDTNAGVTGALAQVIIFLANNLETLVRIIGGVITGITILAGPTVFGLLVARFQILVGVIALNPFGALAIAVTQVIGILIAFADTINLGSGRFVSLGAIVIEIISTITNAIGSFLSFFTDNFPVVSDTFLAVFGDLDLSLEGFLRFFARGFDGIVGIAVGAGRALLNGFGLVPQALEAIFATVLNNIIARINNFLNEVSRRINAVTGEILNIRLPTFGNVATSSVPNFSQSIAEGFSQGFSQSSFFEDTITGIFDRAAARSSRNAGRGTIAAPAITGSSGSVSSATSVAADAGRFPDLNVGRVSNEIEGLGELLTDLGRPITTISSGTRNLESSFRDGSDSIDNLNDAVQRTIASTNSLGQAYTSSTGNARAFGSEVGNFGGQVERVGTASRTGSSGLDIIIQALENSGGLNEIITGLGSGGLGQILSQALDNTEGFGDGVKDTFGDILREASQVVEQFANGGDVDIAAFTRDVFQRLLRAAQSGITQAASTPAPAPAAPSFRAPPPIRIPPQVSAQPRGVSSSGAIVQANTGFNVANGGGGSGVGGGGRRSTLQTGRAFRQTFSQATGRNSAGGTGGAFVTGFRTRFQTGGSFRIGGSGGPDSQMVGIQGSPGEIVDVRRPGQPDGTSLAQSGGSPVNLRIVNVVDPNQALGAISSAEGEEVIMNVIDRNKETVERIIR